MTHTRNSRRAMTAIEVLVATLLATLMLASVVGVVGALARQGRALRAGAPGPQWQRSLAEQLLWDLRNAREMTTSPWGVRLVGYGGRDFVTGRPTGRPAEIQYYLRDAAGGRCLVRREQHLDARSTDRVRTELVCRGVDRIEWGAGMMDTATPKPGLLAPSSSRESTAVPDRVAVRFYSTEPGPPLLDRVLILR